MFQTLNFQLLTTRFHPFNFVFYSINAQTFQTIRFIFFACKIKSYRLISSCKSSESKESQQIDRVFTKSLIPFFHQNRFLTFFPGCASSNLAFSKSLFVDCQIIWFFVRNSDKWIFVHQLCNFCSIHQRESIVCFNFHQIKLFHVWFFVLILCFAHFLFFNCLLLILVLLIYSLFRLESLFNTIQISRSSKTGLSLFVQMTKTVSSFFI
jgi:hypothetical protein